VRLDGFFVQQFFYDLAGRQLFVLQHEFEYFLGNRSIPHRCEGQPVEGRWSVFTQGSFMARRAVTLVGGQSVDGEDRIPFLYHAVTFDLGHD